MAEYWNELVTRKSWEKLQEISREFDIIAIGGWAVYLWAQQHKSKDIDVIVDFTTLEKLRQAFELVKNDRLKKYEVKFADFDMDVYAPHYSKLELPVEELLETYTATVDGIKTIIPEALLILKQGAEKSRRNSAKGEKDAIDIMSLLIYAVDLEEYAKLLKKYNKTKFLAELETVLISFDNKKSFYVNKNFKEFSQWKKATLEKIRKLK